MIAMDFAVGFVRDRYGCAKQFEVAQQPVRIERLIREERQCPTSALLVPNRAIFQERFWFIVTTEE